MKQEQISITPAWKNTCLTHVFAITVPQVFVIKHSKKKITVYSFWLAHLIQLLE